MATLERPLFEVADAWRAAYPDAVVGILVMRRVANPALHPALEQHKSALTADLRSRYAASDPASLKSHLALAAFDAYYRRFRKTYHVAQQLDSVARKGKPVPSRAALVEAMFMAELEHGLLTAGHDLDALELPVRLDVATGEERYTLINGRDQVAKADDMMMADRDGVISTIIYGPDARSRISQGTTSALFATYGPPGITAGMMRAHQAAIEANIRLIAPDADVIASEIVLAAD